MGVFSVVLLPSLSDLVRNPKYRFSRDTAQFFSLRILPRRKHVRMG